MKDAWRESQKIINQIKKKETEEKIKKVIFSTYEFFWKKPFFIQKPMSKRKL